jgi:hypothetical protein
MTAGPLASPPASSLRAALRSAKRWSLRTTRGVALAVDPTPAVVAHRRPGASTGCLCCVYRPENVPVVHRLLDEAEGAGLEPRLWALDVVAPTLAAHTVGSGPATRQVLLNRLLAHDEDVPRWVVFADDDVEIRHGSLAGLLDVATVTGSDAAQPAHDARSGASSGFMRATPGLVARRTGFVEVGPLLALGPRAQAAFLPLDESLGMGWGQDYLWSRAVADLSLVATVVDSVRMRHLGVPGEAYDAEAARATMHACVRRAGYDGPSGPHHVLSRWWVWQAERSWVTTSPAVPSTDRPAR